MAQVYTLAPNVARQYLTDDAEPADGYFLYTKVAGTNTDAPTYQTSNGTLHANPIELDSSGRIEGSQEIFMAPGSVQDWTLKDTAGVTIWFKPGVGSVPASAVNVDIDITAGEDLDAGDLGYVSNGEGGKVAGKVYKADNATPYSGLNPIVGFIVADVLSGFPGKMRTDGQITLAGPLVPGSTYYVGTAGAITATIPAFARSVGVADTTIDLIIAANPAPTGSASNIDLLFIDCML